MVSPQRKAHRCKAGRRRACRFRKKFAECGPSSVGPRSFHLWLTGAFSNERDDINMSCPLSFQRSIGLSSIPSHHSCSREEERRSWVSMLRRGKRAGLTRVAAIQRLSVLGNLFMPKLDPERTSRVSPLADSPVSSLKLQARDSRCTTSPGPTGIRLLLHRNANQNQNTSVWSSVHSHRSKSTHPAVHIRHTHRQAHLRDPDGLFCARVKRPCYIARSILAAPVRFPLRLGPHRSFDRIKSNQSKA